MTNITILAPPESTLYQHYRAPRCAGKPNAAASAHNMLSTLGVHATHEWLCRPHPAKQPTEPPLLA
jgi:hypothetical protein